MQLCRGQWDGCVVVGGERHLRVFGDGGRVPCLMAVWASLASSVREETYVGVADDGRIQREEGLVEVQSGEDIAYFFREG